MKAHSRSLACALAVLGCLVLSAAEPKAQATIPINFTSDLGSFTGSYTITKFVQQGGQLFAVGTLTGTVQDALGNVLGTIDQTLKLAVGLKQTTGTCDILHLVLGPLDLDLLGLKVHLDKVVLDITAQQGPGNLLGNLLCAVANLLNGNGSLTGLAGLLNNILRILAL